MSGQPLRARGRPPKTSSLAFRLAALAAAGRPISQERISAQINRVLNPASVTQPTVGKWLRHQLPRYARTTVSIKRPDQVEIHVACLLFRRAPARAMPLLRQLAREPLVSRVEYWRGETNVFAEVMALDEQGVEDIIARYEPDAVYSLVERHERTRAVLRRLAREATSRA
jgi:hypothetical protein